MLYYLHLLILTCLHKVQGFSLGLSSEAVSIHDIGLIAQSLHTYTTFFFLKLIFHKKITNESCVSFLFCLVYEHSTSIISTERTKLPIDTHANSYKNR